MKVGFILCLALILTGSWITAGCVSRPKLADTHTVVVATYEISDKASGTLIYGTLRQHGIIAIGISSGGWVDVNVGESQAAEARRIISNLSPEGHSLRVITK